MVASTCYIGFFIACLVIAIVLDYFHRGNLVVDIAHMSTGAIEARMEKVNFMLENESMTEIEAAELEVEFTAMEDELEYRRQDAAWDSMNPRENTPCLDQPWWRVTQ